jgi:leader peptidase (prepilin peptidase)/N-methyltransferase
MMKEIIQFLFVLILGLFSGMMVNYLADVLPWKRKLVRPFCPSCDATQALTNYLVFPRRCPHCATPRSWRTWVLELVYISLALWSWDHPANKLGFWAGWLVLLYFGVIIVIDVEHRLIMHPVSWVGVMLGLGVGFIRNGWLETLIGGAAGYGVMWLFYWLGESIMRRLARLRGRTLNDVALGYGDVNLSGVLGLMLGWPLILPGLVLAVLIGGLVSLVYLVVMLLMRRYQLFTALPYGPFLIAGAFVFLFLGETLLIILGD